jgi:O-antigen ligase
MKTLSLNSQGNLSRKKLLALAFFLLSLVLAYLSAGYILSGDLASLLTLGMVSAGLSIGAAILINWRNGAYFFLAWLLFEDFARKFLGNNMAIYFAKDALLLLVYLSFWGAYRRKDRELQTFRPPFLPVLLVFVWYAAMQVFNPASTSIFYGLLGMKIYFYYVPLLFVGYAIINSEADLRKFFYINLGMMLIIASLGIAQSIIGPRFLNPEVIAEDIRALSETYRVAPVSGARVYRPTSVFVSAGRFADLLIVGWIMVFGFSAYLLLRERRGRLLTSSALAVMAAACLMCSSRGVFMWSLGSTLIGAAAFLWGAPWRQGEVLRVIRGLQRVALGIALAVVVLLFAYPDAILGRLAVYSETLDPRSPRSELVHRAGEYPLQNFLGAFDYDRWPYGYGIGTVSLGGQYVSRIFHVRPPVGGVESGFGTIIVEMGILGLVFWISMSLAIMIAAWKIVRGLKGSPWFPLAFMILLYAIVLLLPMTFASMSGYQDFILNAYLWLLLGILFRLPKLAQGVSLSAGTAASQTAVGRDR